MFEQLGIRISSSRRRHGVAGRASDGGSAICGIVARFAVGGIFGKRGSSILGGGGGWRARGGLFGGDAARSVGLVQGGRGLDVVSRGTHVGHGVVEVCVKRG